MKRSEATPELLKALEDPENIYTFEEDKVYSDMGSAYIRTKGWKLTSLTDEQREEIERYLEIEMKKRYGDSWRIE